MADVLPADLTQVDPADAWKPWNPGANGWNRKWAAHLYRRAAFGAAPAEMDRALGEGFPKTLERLVAGEPDAAEKLELLNETGQFYNEPANLRAWWLYAMIEGGHPLREKLTLFWHNHFATSYAKVRSTKLMYEQNVTLRKHALGHFRPFLLDMSRDTAMLIWLDSNRNVKGAANENYAREVMELFSLGVGNYTEKDIQEAARAFTGWHHDAEMTHFEFNRALHDAGPKTVFGKTGNWDGGDVIRLCCDHEACAKFLVGKLYNYLVSETKPPAKLLEPLAARFRESNYDIASLVNTMLGSRLFFSEHAYRKRVKWPVEFAVESVRAVTPGRVPLSDLVAPLGKMGQVLFAPPNVKGWRTGTDWLNSATLLARNNFAETVALGEWSKQGARRGPRDAAVAEVVKPTEPPVPLMAYPETAAGAVAGAAAAATAPGVIENTDGTKLLAAAPPGAAGAAPGQPGSSSAPPAPPEAGVDAVATIYATNPKIPAEVVKRMGEVLYGEAPPTAVAAKIEKFLLTPGPAAAATPPADPPKGSRRGSKSPTPTKVEAQPPAPKEKSQEKSEAESKPLKPEDVKIDSPEFKARVREALHAMMCLPEYQLN
jgi:hypothetical protein